MIQRPGTRKRSVRYRWLAVGAATLYVALAACTRNSTQDSPSTREATDGERQKAAVDANGKQPEKIDADWRVHEFCLDDRGHIGFVQRSDHDDYVFVLAESDGTIVSTLNLKSILGQEPIFPRVAWINQSRWVIAAPEICADGAAQAWWLDADSGEFSAISTEGYMFFWAITALGDGGFVATIELKTGTSPHNALVAHDASGALLWQVDEDPDTPAGRFATNDVAVTAAGEIVLFEAAPSRGVCFYSRAGGFVRRIETVARWGRQLAEPGWLTADARGGLLVYDYKCIPPLLRIDKAGELAGTIEPRFADGRALGALTGGVRTGAGGVMWVSEGRGLHRLNSAGIVEVTLGLRAD